MIILLLILCYIACVPVCLGLLYPNLLGENGYAQLSKKENREHYGMALLFSLLLSGFGPVGIIIALCMTGFGYHGFRIKIIKD